MGTLATCAHARHRTSSSGPRQATEPSNPSKFTRFTNSDKGPDFVDSSPPLRVSACCPAHLACHGMHYERQSVGVMTFVHVIILLQLERRGQWLLDKAGASRLRGVSIRVHHFASQLSMITAVM